MGGDLPWAGIAHFFLAHRRHVVVICLVTRRMVMTYKRLPFLTRAERAAILECCQRTPEGCLIFTPPHGGRPNLFVIRGQSYQVTRLVWSEKHCHSHAAELALHTHEVIHIAECPHTGGRHVGLIPLCIEPTHLRLGTILCRVRESQIRQEAL